MIKLKNFSYLIKKWSNVILHIGYTNLDYYMTPTRLLEFLNNFFISDIEFEELDCVQTLHLTLIEKNNEEDK